MSSPVGRLYARDEHLVLHCRMRCKFYRKVDSAKCHSQVVARLRNDGRWEIIFLARHNHNKQVSDVKQIVKNISAFRRSMGKHHSSIAGAFAECIEISLMKRKNSSHQMLYQSCQWISARIKK